MEWSFQTWTTVGYGDLSPKNNTEIIISMIWMVIGAGFLYPYVLTNTNTFFKSLNYF